MAVKFCGAVQKTDVNVSSIAEIFKYSTFAGLVEGGASFLLMFAGAGGERQKA